MPIAVVEIPIWLPAGQLPDGAAASEQTSRPVSEAISPWGRVMSKRERFCSPSWRRMRIVSGERVYDETMRVIHAGSSKMTGIITAIEGIAF